VSRLEKPEIDRITVNEKVIMLTLNAANHPPPKRRGGNGKAKLSGGRVHWPC